VDRGRRDGKLDDETAPLLAGVECGRVMLNGTDLGEKRVDWRYRRISLGPRRTGAVDPEHDTLRVSRASDGPIVINACVSKVI